MVSDKKKVTLKGLVYNLRTQAEGVKTFVDGEQTKLVDYYRGNLPTPYVTGQTIRPVNVCYPQVREQAASLKAVFGPNSRFVEYTDPTNSGLDVSAVTEAVRQGLQKAQFYKKFNKGTLKSLIVGSFFLKPYWAVEDVPCHIETDWMTEDEWETSVVSAYPAEQFKNVKAKVTERQSVDSVVPVADEMGQPVVDETGQPMVEKVTTKLVRGEVDYVEIKEGLELEEIPASEILNLASDTDIEEASYICQRTHKARDDLINMFPKATKLINDTPAGLSTEHEETDESIPSDMIFETTNAYDKGLDIVEYCVHYVRTAKLGRRALYEVHTVGTECEVMDISEITDDIIPIFKFDPERDFDKFWPASWMSHITEEQDTQTEVKFSMLYNGRLANIAKYRGVKNQYDRESVLDPAPNRVIEESAPGMVDIVPHNPLPQAYLALGQDSERRVETITGSKAAPAGAEDDLFNASATAARIADTAREANVKSIAHNLAEELERFYAYVYDLYRTYSGQAFSVTVGGEEVVVQPMDWPEGVETKINIITAQDKADHFGNVGYLTQQWANLRQTSVTTVEAYDVLVKMAEDMDCEDLLTAIVKPEDFPPPPAPTPEQKLAIAQVQAEIQKTQSEVQVAQIKATAELKKVDADIIHDRYKAQAEGMTKAEMVALENRKQDFEEAKLSVEIPLEINQRRAVKLGSD